MFNLNSTWIDFKCPRCKYSIDIQMIDIKLEKITFCHNCKVHIKPIDDNASFYSGANRINEAMKSLEQTLKNFGK